MNIYDFTVKDRNGNDVSLSKYKGKTLLIVNTATRCRFTEQYKTLEIMYEEMNDRNFEILDFPCDQFLNQAPGTDEEIHSFCETKYGITFEQFAKVEVVGDNADPLFKYLQNCIGFQGFGLAKDAGKLLKLQSKLECMAKSKNSETTQIKWNFTKFLVSDTGEVVARFEPTEPVEMVMIEVNRQLNGEHLGEKRLFLSRKTVDESSATEENLSQQRKKGTTLIGVLSYLMYIAFAFSILFYVKTSMTPIVVCRVLIISIPGTFLMSLATSAFGKIGEMQLNRLCYALEQTKKGNYKFRLIENENMRMEKAYHDYNDMNKTMEETMEKMQQAIEEADAANQAKSNFLSNMSHEMRTPLNAVLGMDEMIIRESNESEIKKYAIDIKNAGKSLLTLINDILDLSKIEANKMEIIPVEYDLSSVINDLINMVSEKAKAKNLELKVKVNEKMPHVLIGDEVRIKQVCLNILNNAVKYTNEGSVTMSFNAYEKSGKHILVFSCKDTGQGIKEENMAKLCEPFARIEEERNRHVEGTGLGMSITKNLLEMMGSSLQVESTYGEGSTFSFEVIQEVVKDEPIGNFEDSYKKSLANEKQYHESFHAPKAKLLVVDDVEMNLTVVKSFLKKTQMQIEAVTSGQHAVELCKHTKFDIIFVDHMMPDMDGFETKDAIKQKEGLNNATPVIVLTANAVSGAREEYMKAGFDDYLTKPIDSVKLENLIIKFLPENLVERDIEEETAENSETVGSTPVLQEILKIEEIDVEKGIEASGGVEAYISVVENFATTAEDRLELINQYYCNLDYKNYTIQVHALKSSARIIGDMALSELAKELETSGNALDEENIRAKTDTLLDMYENIRMKLLPIFESKEQKPLIETDMLKDGIQSLYEALEAFDMDTADSIMESLSEYEMPDAFKDTFSRIKILMNEVERDAIMELITNSKDKL